MSKSKKTRHFKKIPRLVTVILSLFILNVCFPTSFVFANSEINIELLHELSNRERIENGLNPLVLNDNLNKSAIDKASHMFTNNYWDHNSPDGIEPWDFIKANDYQYEIAGENLAKDFINPEDVIDGWMNSPTHRDNILKDNYVDVGYAVLDGNLLGKETTLVVAMYGEPKASVKTNGAQSSVMVSLIVEATELNTNINNTEQNNQDDTIDGLVKGIIDSAPVNTYLSSNSNTKLLIMIICTSFLFIAIRLLLSNLRDKNGFDYILFKKIPVFGSFILTMTFIVAIASSLGVVFS